MKKKLFLLSFLYLIMENSFSQNVLISNSNFPNEPSIIMDPKNPRYIVAAANLDNYYYSSDTGKTWTSKRLSSK